MTTDFTCRGCGKIFDGIKGYWRTSIDLSYFAYICPYCGQAHAQANLNNGHIPNYIRTMTNTIILGDKETWKKD